MTMSTRDRWLTEGLALLASDGAAGLRTDRAAARLGLTKGSFHHHFAGIEDYRRAVLARHEESQLAVLRDLAADLRDTPADQALGSLPDRLGELLRTDLERAVRSWAVTDPDARAVQERLDAARLAFLRELWTGLLRDDRRAHTAALVPHLLAIGASMAQPPVDESDLRAVFELLARLIPGVAGD